MKTTHALAPVCLLVGILIANVSDLGAWAYQLNGSLNVDDAAEAVAVNGSGDVFVGGSLNSAPYPAEPVPMTWVIVRLAGDTGEETWRREFPGTYYDSVWALALDGEEGLVAAGSFHGVMGIKKLSQSDGSTVWEHEIPGSQPSSIWAAAATVKFDSEGNVLVGGQLETSRLNAAFCVVKLSGTDGTELWRYTYLNPGPGFFVGSVADLTFSPAGSVVATGGGTHFSPVAGPHGDLLTVELSADDGHEFWRQEEEFKGGASVQTDLAGDVFVTGAGSYPDGIHARKLDGGSGLEQWRTGLEVSYSGNGVGALDPAGDLFIAGVLNQDYPNFSFVVGKVSGAGEVQWIRKPFGRTGDSQYASALCLDGSGNPVAVGASAVGGTGADFAVVKHTSAGDESWRRVLSGPGTGEDVADACAVDAAGDVIAAGSMTQASGGKDFIVVKLSGDTGQDPNPDPLALLSLLKDEVEGLDLRRGLETSLVAKLNACANYLPGDVDSAAASLMAFIRQVRAQRGKMLTPEQADQLILDASEILRILTGLSIQKSLPDRVPRQTDPIRHGPVPGSGTLNGLSKLP